ncbi:hypothetical protein CGLO_14473 [Colletotrichum gloeosporioides Cg-14]|uniref:Uncharacterized protein n=1 Tax=Colletotrichum gloeosporioides (strain Cg-14) TaxID=1237896 RepID=T0L4M1_COLGC|nr:hypothetical protein CGLO_14473 [Colletotrichum gloeosporioides Cg-14]
MNLASAFA